MELVNLTPHEVAIETYCGESPMTLRIPPSGTVARVATVPQEEGKTDGVRFVSQSYGATEGLPKFNPDTALIVSAMVRAANPDRKDICSPADMIRDEQGRIVGCRALEVNP